VAVKDPDITVAKIYFPQEKQIMVHQSRVKCCPTNFPARFYWYSNNQRGQGKMPTWVEDLLASCQDGEVDQADTSGTSGEVSNVDPDTDAQSEGTITQLEEESNAQPAVQTNENPAELITLPRRPTGYSLQKKPCPSRKLMDAQARD